MKGVFGQALSHFQEKELFSPQICPAFHLMGKLGYWHKNCIGGKLGMFASTEDFFPQEGEILRENVLPSLFEKNFPKVSSFLKQKKPLLK